MTRERCIEAARIAIAGLAAVLYWWQLVPIEVLGAALTLGLYPLVKIGLLDLVREQETGTEIIAALNTDRARGWVCRSSTAHATPRAWAAT